MGSRHRAPSDPRFRTGREGQVHRVTGPEKIYRQLASGNVTTLTTLSADLHLAILNVDGCIDHVRYAAGVPTWDSPDASTRFNMKAWAANAAAQVGLVRLNRAKLGVDRATADYEWMELQATRIIEWWREHKDTYVSPLFFLLARIDVMMKLEEVATTYGGLLDSARDFFTTDGFTDEQLAWLENGLARALRFDLDDPTSIGPAIPDTLATGDDDGMMIPQGLGYDPVTGNLVQTSYDSGGDGRDDDRATLSLIDPDTGEVIRSVDLGAPDGGAAPSHAGGVSVHDGQVYVSSSGNPGRLYQYSMADILASAPGDPVAVQGEPQEVAAGAYSTIDRGILYVGTFSEKDTGKLYTYEKDPDTGKWVPTGDGPYDAPPRTQGIAVTDGHIFFSTSFKRGFDSELIAIDRATGLEVGSERLPNMAEGLVLLPEGIVTTYESGSTKYSHRPPNTPPQDMWGSMNMTLTPYSEFGLTSGAVEVEPATLTEAASSFREAEAGIDRTKTEIDRLTLPARVLGGVPEAATFATALVGHLDTTADWLDESRVTADLTAEGLVQSALDYEKTDDGVAGDVQNLLRFLGTLG